MALQEELESQGNVLFKYRGTLPLLLLLIGVLVYIYTKVYSTGFENVISFQAYELACFAVSFFGLIIRIYTVGYTPKNTSGRNTEGQLADELNTRGIYSMVRHPLYVGNFFMWLGTAMLTQNLWYIIAFVFMYWVYYERIMFAEEQFLRRKFGEVYIDWSKITPAFVLSFKNFKSPKMNFSIKKVIKKEKNGLTAIFVIFLLFRAIGDYITSKTFVIDSWLFYITMGSIVLYFILKFIKKYTAAFDEEGR